MRYGSLFSGIGGMDLGLDRAGMECAWQVEIDPYCRRVLAKHWPDVPKFEDVREVGAHNLEPVGLIAGGFPCQDISYAGKGAGIEGERSGLWTEFHRIICELRPRYVIVENVPALLARGLGRVLGDLAESGYDAEWDCIPAAAVGAPYARDRVFIVGVIANSINVGSERICARFKQAPIPSRDSRQILHESRSESAYRRWKQQPNRTWDQVVNESTICRMAHGVPNRVDRLKGLGNAVVPQVAEYIGRMILQSMKKGD